MDITDFLAWEEKQDVRHEFDGVLAKAMTGGTNAHAAIEARLIRALGNHLDGKPCQPFGSNLRFKLAHSVRYADASVICTPLDPSGTFATSPVVVFEILSASTANKDLGVKKLEYQATPSVQRYVLLQQTHRVAEVFYRKDSEDDGWAFEFLLDDDILDMPEIGISISLAEIYKDLIMTGRRP